MGERGGRESKRGGGTAQLFVGCGLVGCGFVGCVYVGRRFVARVAGSQPLNVKAVNRLSRPHL